MTVEEFLRHEDLSDVRHEYVAGELYAMSGVTRRHNRISMNVAAWLRAASGDGPCETLAIDVMLRVGPDTIYYPDVMVTCDGGDDASRLVDDACLVVEVTSPSTRRTDRREKLAAYRRCPTVQAYLIVEQGERLVERHWRDASGEWQHETLASGVVPIRCPPTELPLDEIYRGVTFDAGDDDETPRPPLRVREPEPA
jgi:Uma2 family endonuclease